MPKRVKSVYLWGLAAISGLLFAACAGSSGGAKGQLDVPLDMPEVCQDLDFNVNVEMREVCGVKVRNYGGYKNIMEYRLLLRPKAAKIVKKGQQLELRLDKTLPIDLPASFQGKILFNESVRTKFIKSEWDYQEFIPEGETTRIRMMKITIPFNEIESQSVCYLIPPKTKSPEHIKRGYANQLENLSCDKFEKLKSRANLE